MGEQLTTHRSVPAESLIRDLRLGLGWSQTRLADELCAVSGYDSITRETVSRWEHGKRHPGRFWLRHLADTLQVPLYVLEGHVRRREMLKLACTLAGTAAVLPAAHQATADLYTAITAGDPGPLATIQTSHQTDLTLAGLARQEHPTVLRLARWMDDGDSAVLRVNAAGILAKTRDADLGNAVAALLRRDHDVRMRYLRAVSARVGNSTKALAGELASPRDAGARWCAAWLLGQDDTPAARQALTSALRTEPVAENLRAIAMILTGDPPCTS